MTIPDTAKSSGMTAPLGGEWRGEGDAKVVHLPELQTSRESKTTAALHHPLGASLRMLPNGRRKKGTPKQNITIASGGHFK